MTLEGMFFDIHKYEEVHYLCIMCCDRFSMFFDRRMFH